MRLLPMFLYYFWWHYTTAIGDLSRNGNNLIVFLWNFFSIDHLFAHLFSPFRRLGEKYPEHFDLGKYISAFIVNTLMRIVGFITRIGLIVFGLLTVIVSIFLFLATVIVWLALPAIVLFMLILGFRLLIS